MCFLILFFLAGTVPRILNLQSLAGWLHDPILPKAPRKDLETDSSLACEYAIRLFKSCRFLPESGRAGFNQHRARFLPS
jgi:hypothetical protein